MEFSSGFCFSIKIFSPRKVSSAVLKLANILKCSLLNWWSSVWECSLIAEKGILLRYCPVLKLFPMCSKILILKDLVVHPRYLTEQLGHLNSYTTLEHTVSGIFSLTLKNYPIVKLLMNIILKLSAGKFCFKILLIFFLRA